MKRLVFATFKLTLLGAALLAAALLSAALTMRVVLASQEVPVPSLINKKLPLAELLAARSSLHVRVEGKRHDPHIPADQIATQVPPAGSTLKAHRNIRVWISQGPERQMIPSVEGESVRTARLALDQARVPTARVIEVDDSAPSGTTILQRPPAGAAEGVGEGASLLVSRGIEARAYIMPDLIGRPAEPVIEALRQAGFKVTNVRQRSYPGVAPGIVLKHIPAAGYPISLRTAVSLDVSKDSL
jgi:eukaryotic-like serine/threonine-protein kinase